MRSCDALSNISCWTHSWVACYLRHIYSHVTSFNASAPFANLINSTVSQNVFPVVLKCAEFSPVSKRMHFAKTIVAIPSCEICQRCKNNHFSPETYSGCRKCGPVKSIWLFATRSIGLKVVRMRINLLGTRRNDRHFADGIFKCNSSETMCSYFD